jgi:hypothetical protein
MNAIERIQGFACEVTQKEWEELVRVADSVGVKVGSISRIDGIYSNKYPYAAITNRKNNLCTFPTREGNTLIPYPDFLSKLKGDEKWELKAGVEVQCSQDMEDWVIVEYIAFSKSVHICWKEDGTVDSFNYWRPIETITRQEAEALLNKRIID